MNLIDWIMSWSRPRPKPTPAPIPPIPMDDEVPTARVVILINEFRGEHNLRPLVVHSDLIRSAMSHAADMSAHGELTHVGSDDSMSEERIHRAGYRARRTGECIAWGQTAEAVVNKWVHHPPHREVLLEHYRHIGVGRSDGYWVVDLASPA